MLFFRLNYILGHGKSWPFHGTNLMLHGCATFLLGCICKQVLQLQKLTCLITASLFAVHPIHTEAVSSVTRFFIYFGYFEKKFWGSNVEPSLVEKIASYRASAFAGVFKNANLIIFPKKCNTFLCL